MTTQVESSLSTYDDYLTLPADSNRYEIVRGELYMTPSPGERHQDVLRKLLSEMNQFVESRKAGKISIAPFDVVLSFTDIVQPDLFFIAADRLEIIKPKNMVAAPDLVVEVLSEHTKTLDRTVKFTLYERAVVKEYRIVDPEAQTAEQYVRKEENLVQHALLKINDTITIQVIPDATLPVQSFLE